MLLLLAAHRPATIAAPQARAAAVLVPLRRRLPCPPAGASTPAAPAAPATPAAPRNDDTLQASDLEVILTRRSEHLPAHPGQVAFPGGVVDTHDPNAVATALRETNEELGVAPSHIRVVGQLDELWTVTGFHITPVVGLVAAGASLHPNPSEVTKVFAVPLAALRCAGGWHRQVHQYRGNTVTSWHFPYAGEDVWGATALILRGLVDLLGWIP